MVGMVAAMPVHTIILKHIKAVAAEVVPMSVLTKLRSTPVLLSPVAAVALDITVMLAATAAALPVMLVTAALPTIMDSQVLKQLEV